MDLTNYTTGYVTTSAEPAIKPEIGQSAPAQQTATGIGTGWGVVAGYSAAPTPCIGTFRRMLCDPTIAIGMQTIIAPIIASSWKYVASDDAPDDAVELVRKAFDVQRIRILRDALRSVAFGWYPFEKVWSVEKGRYVIRHRGLLPELCRVMVDKDTKMLAGIKAGNVELLNDKSWLVTHDREGDNYYGRSRLLNILDQWHEGNEISKKGGQLATKAASIIPIVHYPPGGGDGLNGEKISNFESTAAILNQLQSARGIALPNLAGDASALMRNPELAGKSAWVISFLEAAGAAQSLGSMTERQRYLDSLKLRGLFVPERAVTEASLSGSRADAENSADLALLSCEQLHADIVESLNESGGVREMLTINFGDQAAEWVKIEPAPLDDKKRGVFKQLFAAVMAMPAMAEDLMTQIDIDAVCDALDIPKLDKDKPITLAALPSVPDEKTVDPDKTKTSGSY